MMALNRPAGGFEGLEYRQSVGCGFACAGLRLRDDVVGFCEQVGMVSFWIAVGVSNPFGAYGFEHLLESPRALKSSVMVMCMFYSAQRYDKKPKNV